MSAEFYRVVPDVKGCEHCGAEATWTVAWTEDDEEVQLGESWVDQDTAQDVAAYLNMAYDVGYKAAIKLVAEGA